MHFQNILYGLTKLILLWCYKNEHLDVFYYQDELDEIIVLIREGFNLVFQYGGGVRSPIPSKSGAYKKNWGISIRFVLGQGEALFDNKLSTFHTFKNRQSLLYRHTDKTKTDTKPGNK